MLPTIKDATDRLRFPNPHRRQPCRQCYALYFISFLDQIRLLQKCFLSRSCCPDYCQLEAYRKWHGPILDFLRMIRRRVE